MNPFFQSIAGSIVRWGLGLFAGWLLSRGVQLDAATITALTTAIVALAWSLWRKYVDRQIQVTTQIMPKGVTEREVEAHIASGAPIPSVLTPKDAVPVAIPT